VLYDWEELADLLKLCTTKKEAALERKAVAGEINVTVAIFSLKQSTGRWVDREVHNDDLRLRGAQHLQRFTTPGRHRDHFQCGAAQVHSGSRKSSRRRASSRRGVQGGARR
jgi:hypothetical protein